MSDEQPQGELTKPEDDSPVVESSVLAGPDESPIPAEVERFMGISAQFGPQSSPLAEKITPEHIEGVIQTQKLSIEKGFEDNELTRRHMRFGLVAILIFILAMVGVLLGTGNQALVEPVLVALVLVGGAGAGGWGIAKSQQ